jgi:hypothetical protein
MTDEPGAGASTPAPSAITVPETSSPSTSVTPGGSGMPLRCRISGRLTPAPVNANQHFTGSWHRYRALHLF